jgi:hypothetical protein
MTQFEDELREQEKKAEIESWERMARADAIWHPSDEEYDRIIDQWTYKPTVSRPVQVWCAVVGGVLFLGSLFWILYLLNGGLL